MKFFKKITVLICFLVIIICVFLGFMIFSVPDLSVEKITDIKQTLTVYDSDNNVCATINSGQNRQNVSIDEIPKDTVNALIATEDIRFYEHNGIDIKRIFGAILSDIKAGSFKEGASTITQQLIKNSHLTNEKTIMRKVNEAILALQLENKYEKNEILEMYLNFVYFGRGAYGIQTASKAYFGIDAKDLTCSQGAVLIGLLKAPNKYAPHINMEKAVYRRNTVLKQMEKYGFIQKEDYEKYSKEEIKIIEQQKTEDYGYFTDYVLEQGAENLGITVSDFMGGGYQVYTTLDSYLQQEAQNVYENKENFPDDSVQSAAVILNNENSSISAMIGGREHKGMRLYNRATAFRQPGSCIKPVLVYAPAFEKNLITPATILDDYRKDFNGYSPTNYKDQYYGKITVRRALSLSLNVPAVELLQQTGIEYSKNYAKRVGITFNETDTNLAISLGGMKYGTSVLELTGAYCSFANNGFYEEPWCIQKITDYDGNVLYEHKSNKTQVFKDSTAFLITDILCDVSKQSSNPLSKLNKKIACKTGTVAYVKGNSDALCCAYTKTHTVSVWLGYDKTDENNYLSSEITGSTYPSLLAKNMFEKIIEKYGYQDFIMPDSVVLKEIDSYSLKNENKIYLATEHTPKNNILKEYFDKNNCPTRSNVYWQAPLKVNDASISLNELRQAEISFTIKQSHVDYYIYKNGQELVKLTGKQNERIKYIDENHTTGDSYYILPKHKLVFVSGTALTGEKSKELTLN